MNKKNQKIIIFKTQTAEMLIDWMLIFSFSIISIEKLLEELKFNHRHCSSFSMQANFGLCATNNVFRSWLIKYFILHSQQSIDGKTTNISNIFHDSHA